MKQFGGKVLFLDRANINTDEIIPAKYLTEITKQALQPHLLEDLNLPGFDPHRDIAGKRVIITRENFGCGSSREHAAWALEVNDITTVIASGFARIFKQNMFNCGMLAIELSPMVVDRLFSRYSSIGATIAVDLPSSVLTVTAPGMTLETIPFSLTPFEAALVNAGGWVEYADAMY
ncbi:MAG: 3-isopropylmalate dehydratase small subunit [Desulfobacterota bacterium]|nr:3-isopropylmalate dehydratase small subunit [Thermodesulfobacteriota bacterium]